ncbi:MAG: DNA alkylation repair protein [Nanoarchaeota archaeon]|nr:DNA alkylation repair protein [Nanoarchaeota archaeon]
MLNKLIKELKKYAKLGDAEFLQRFFKTGKGDYGEGQIFWGTGTTNKRKLAKKYIDLDLKSVQKMFAKNIHDLKFTALVLLVNKYKKADDKIRKEIIKLYLKNAKEINNWDLVDVSAYHILGDYLIDKKRNILYKLAKSKNLWEKRIAIISTYAFIRIGQYKDTLKIAEILLKDRHDLIHKAVGWMLREVGKKDQKVLEQFLKKHYKQMPRTMLRYSIEKFDEKKRKFYMKK